MVEATTFTLDDGSERTLFVREWSDAATPARSVVLIAHGLSEHGARYDGVARAFAEAGFRTYAPDHRGHGRTANGAYGDAGPGGWQGIVDDALAVLERAASSDPGLPIFYVGHSMGSILGQRFIALHGERLAGAVLIGSPSKLTDPAVFEQAQAAAAAAPSEPSLLFGALFSSFNAPFEQITGFEWLSRDPAEVKKYVDDPMSGNPLTNATLLDFAGGWGQAWSDDTRARVPASLPILIVSGERDSAGGNGEAARELADAYKANGVRDVTLRLYPDARHEVLNETNRDDVVREITEWLGAHLPVRKT